MKHKTVSVSGETFRTALVPVAAVLSTLGALCGAVSMVLLFTSGGLESLVQDLYLSGITDSSALTTWKVIHIAATVVGCLWACLMTAQLWTMVLGKPGLGLLRLSTAAEWTVHGLNAVGIGLLLLLAYKLVRYIILCLGINEGVYLLYSMLVSEALMVVLAALLFVGARRFLNSLSDVAASMARAVTSRNLGKGDVPYFAVTGFILLAVLELVLAADRLFTMTIVKGYREEHYAFLMAESPLLLISGGMFVLCALTNVLLAVVLYRFRRLGERLHFEANRLILLLNRNI